MWLKLLFKKKLNQYIKKLEVANQGIKKLYNNEEGGERVIDKKSLSIGKKHKKDDNCCV